VKIKYVGQFIKHFYRRIQPYPNLSYQFDERVKLFLNSPNHPILKSHKLKGAKKDRRAFSITGDTGDIRVVYFTEGDFIYFVDIGTHNQVY